MKTGYLIGIGSNIAPEENVPRVLERLAREFGEVRVSSICRTEPEGIASERHFLNLVVYLETELNETRLKGWLNALEESMGRDRSHPDKKRLDRTADLDILRRLAPGERLSPHALPSESYLRPCFEELAARLELLPDCGGLPSPGGFQLSLNGTRFGNSPALLHLDARSGHLYVTELQHPERQ